MRDQEVKIFNRICSVVVIFTAAALIVTFSQNLLFRSAELYGFYFNDSRAVDKIYTSLSNSEMAGEIAHFMNSWMPEKFEILEDTGYDMESVFDEEEGYNMMIAKRVLDISGLIFVVSLILTVAIYVYFLKNDRKKTLSTMFKVSLGLTAACIVGETVLMVTNEGRSWIVERLGFIILEENSQLLTLLGADFINMAASFLVFMTLTVTALCTYINYVLTKPSRLFY